MSFALAGARCDGGGLDSVTREIHRHLRPERTLLLDLGGRGRGDCVPDDYRYGEVFRCDWMGGLPANAVDWVCDPACDVLVAVETFYDDRILTLARQRGMRVILYAMPELAPWATTAPDRLA